MPLVPETGDGSDTANSYIDVVFADTYHTDRGRVAWQNFTNAQKQHALIRATDYIDKRFGRKFLGERAHRTQALEWPRREVYLDIRYGDLRFLPTEIPLALKQATAEYGLRAALLGELAPDPTLPVPTQDFGVLNPSSPPEGAVLTGQLTFEMERVGPIEERRSFKTTAEVANIQRNKSMQSSLVSDFVLPEYPAADLLIESLIRSNSSRMLGRG